MTLLITLALTFSPPSLPKRASDPAAGMMGVCSGGIMSSLAYSCSEGVKNGAYQIIWEGERITDK